MGYSVELYFKESGEKKIRELWKELHDLGISKYMYDSGDRPHISLLIFDKKDCNIKLLKKSFKTFFERKNSFEIIFSSIGIFQGEEGVTFIGPKPTITLLELQEDFFNKIKNLCVAEQVWEYYMPEYWVPHCIMTIDTTSEEQMMAFDMLRKRFRNLKVVVESVGLVEFNPSLSIEEIKFN